MEPILPTFINSALLNHFILAQFLGLCPFINMTPSFKVSLGLSVATLFVLISSTCLSFFIYHFILYPFDLKSLQLLTFITIIASFVQTIRFCLEKYLPIFHQMFGLYLPLITTNCIVLAVCLINIKSNYSFSQSLANSFGAGIGFLVLMLIFTSLKDELINHSIPRPFQGFPIQLITAGILSLGFMGFSGFSL